MEAGQKIFYIKEQQRELFLPLLPPKVQEAEPVLFGAADSREGTPSGVLAAAEYDGGWEILYIGVEEAYRRQGIGRALVETAAAAVAGVMGTELTAACAVPASGEESSEAVSFFRACRFRTEEISEIRRFRLGDLDGDQLKNRKWKTKARCIALSEIDTAEWQKLCDLIRETGERADASDPGVYLNLGEKSDYQPDVSVAAYDTHARLKGCVLTKDHPDGLELSYLFVFGMNEESARTLGLLLTKAVTNARCLLGKNGSIILNPKNDVTRRMLAKLCGKKDECCGKIVELVREV